MKRSIIPERFRIYLWIGLAWVLLWELTYLAKPPDQFFSWTLNELWRAIYIITINILFFEYGVPFILKKRKYIITQVLTALLVIWVLMMFLHLVCIRGDRLELGLVYILLTGSTRQLQKASPTRRHLALCLFSYSE